MDINDLLKISRELKQFWEDPKWRLIKTDISDISSFRFQKNGGKEIKTIVVDNTRQPSVTTSNIYNDAIYFGKVMDKYVHNPMLPQTEDNDSKIKLAILDNSFSVGGAVWSIVLLLKYIDRDKITPRVYSGRKSEITDYLIDMGIDVYICPPSEFDNLGAWIVDNLRDWGPDVVDGAWSVHWGFHEFREFVPVVVAHAQATEVPWLDENLSAEYCPYDLSLIEKLDGVICVAQAVYDTYPIIHDKAIVIPSPIDLDVFANTDSRDAIRKNLDIGDDTFVVTWVGRISEQKRPDLLLEIVDRVKSQIDNVVFLVAAYLPNYFVSHPIAQVWLNGLDGRPIIWIPDMKPYHAPVIYSATDLFLLNSDWEGLSLTSLEALAAGIPVVCTDVSGQREVVREGYNGFLCNKGDVEGLADTIVDFYRMSPSSKEVLIQNSIESVKPLDAKFNADKTLEFYIRLLEQKDGIKR